MDTIKLSVRFHNLSLLLAMLLSFMSAIVLLGGWVANIAWLRNFGSGYSMQANTAICILSVSLALWLLNPTPPIGLRRTLGLGLAVVPLVLGALTLLEHFYGWDLGIDQAFFRDHDPIPGSHDGRMPLNAALAAAFIGLALLLLTNQAYQVWAENLALIVIVLELLAIFGHSYGAPEFYQIGPHKPQTIQCSCAFLLLGVTMLFARPRQGLMATLSSDSAGGILLRRMLPVAILLPPLIVKLRLTGQNLGWYDAAFGLTLFVTLMIVILCAFIWSSATLLRQVDKQRRQALVDLQEMNQNLDTQVILRTQELAQANEDLRQQVIERTRAESRFRGLFEAAPDAILIVDQQGIILLASPQTELKFGYSQQELQGQPVEILLPESQRGAHRAHLQGYMTMPLRQSMAAASHPHGLRKDGHSFPVSINLSPFESEGKPLVIAIVRDISEQEQLQRERLELAERHEELLQNLPVGVCRYALNSAMPLLEANRTALEMLEAHHLQELLQRPLSMFLKNPQAIEPLHAMLLKQNVIQHAEIELITLQGHSFWAGLSLRLKVDANGSLYCDATFRDISERKATVAKIQDLNAKLEQHATELAATNATLLQEVQRREQAQRRLTTVLESAPDSIVVTDEKGLMVQVNTQTEHWFGYSRDELLGQPVEMLVPTHLRERHAEDRETYLRAPQVRGMGSGRELCGQRKDGSEFSIEASLSPFIEEDKRYVIAIIRDVSMQHQLQHERLQLSERYRMLVENLPLGICRYLPTEPGEFLEINSAMARIFDADSPQHFLQHSTAAQLSGNKEAVLEFNKALVENGMINNFETPVVSLKGRDLWCKIHAQVVGDIQGDSYVYAVVEDITQRKQSELHILELNQALELRRAELEAANKELEAFSYSVSHDLRAPLRAIDGFSQAILEDYQDRLDSTGQDYLRRLRTAAQRMGHLIDDMLQLSRITRADLAVAEVDLSAMAIEIATELSQRDPQRVVDFRISPDLSALGDAQLLRIALTNLFENAWKFTARREITIITFASRDEDQGPVYFIQDNGVGFDMAYVNKLFHAFQRLHDAREFPGTGIGLAIVQRVIQKHGGQIWAQAEPDCGATFYFSLQPIIKSV